MEDGMYFKAVTIATQAQDQSCDWNWCMTHDFTFLELMKTKDIVQIPLF